MSFNRCSVLKGGHGVGRDIKKVKERKKKEVRGTMRGGDNTSLIARTVGKWQRLMVVVVMEVLVVIKQVSKVVEMAVVVIVLEAVAIVCVDVVSW